MLKTSVPYSDTGRFSGIFLDYISGKSTLRPFYTHRPEPASFAAAIREKEFSAANRKLVVKAISEQYAVQAPGLLDQVAPLLDLLQHPATFTVTTGHQLNLFTGPLYSIFKIATTIKLAKELSVAYPDHQFVPVFWMATEDHDFEEINHLHIQDKKIVWEPGFPSMACGRLSLDKIEAVIAEVNEVTGDSELMEGFAEACRNSTSLAQATRKWIHFLFANHSLLIVDGDDKNLKQLFVEEMISDVFQHEAFKTVSETAAELSKHYKVQVTPREINLFHLGPDHRQRIVQDASGRYKVLDTDISFTADELESAIRTTPEQFSPNVVLRPLYQEKILPNLAYIGGPGELAYWLELKSMFDQYKIAFPVLMPRNSFMFLEPQVMRKMAKAGITAQNLFMDREQLLESILNGSLEIKQTVSSTADKIVKAFAELKQPVTSIDPTLSGSLDAEKQKTLKGLAAFEDKIIRALKRKEENKVGQIDWVLHRLFPEGNLQERHQNILALARDRSFVDRVIDASDPFSAMFDILILED
jgi:bacillithiol biosynthesis cysteine-adding enzyme BshC